MANLYYREDLDVHGCVLGSTIDVSGEEGRHAVRVSRLRVGERILVGNGKGLLAGGVVSSIDRDRFSMQVDEVNSLDPATVNVTLVQALAKGDRDERAVEQATEFGVDAIVPWQAARSVSRWDAAGDKQTKGIAKWARIAREAAKQSMRAYVPEVHAPLSLKDLCAEAQSGAAVLVLHPRGVERLSDWARERARSYASLLVVIGPEGGFDDTELDALESAGAHILVLGETVLRTSSAGPAAIAVLNTALGRW